MVQCGDDGVLALQGLGESVGVGRVDGADFDVVGEGGLGGAVVAGEDGDVESVGCEERFDDGAAGVSICLFRIMLENLSQILYSGMCLSKKEDIHLRSLRS